MRTPNRVDTSTLGWVKDEIDQTLNQAREALQGYAAGSDDVTPLRVFVNNVHQVAGTLQMVELDGASQLAQETESLASAVVSGKVDGTGDRTVNELLDQGLAQLSSYMGRLAKGLPDRAIDNVEVINELRKARDAEPLDPYSLFHPDLEIYPSREKSADELDGAEYAARVRELRRQYQMALLRWLRGQEQEDAWQSLADVVTELFQLSRFQVSMQIWWVARAYLDVLKTAQLERDDTRKHPLANLDQLMRKLAEDGEAAIAREGSEKLVRFMLYHIGRSDVRTDQTRAVISLFDLDTLLGADVESVEPPSSDAIAAIQESTLKSLHAVQSVLDDYARSGDAGHAFTAADQHLGEIADAIRGAGVPELADLCTGVRQVLFGGEKPTRSDDALMAAARALLFVEQTVEHPEEVGSDWRQEVAAELDQLHDQAASAEMPSLAIESHEIDAESLDAQELRRLVNAIGGQIADNLKQAEQSLERFARDTTGVESLETVVDSLQQVHGAVRMLGQNKLCDLLELAIGHLRAMISGDAYATDAQMDALAVTIGTTDAYVEGMARDAANIDALLARAMDELENAVSGDSMVTADPNATLKRIRDSFAVWIQDSSDYEAFRTLRQSLRDIGALAHQQDQLSLRRIAQEMTNLLDIVTDDPSFLSEEVEETLRRSLATLSELSRSLEGAGAGETAEDEAPVEPEKTGTEQEGEDDDDDVVREIFAEEAAECLQEIESGVAALRKDTSDESVLTEVRRNFHTIKGSGRMAKSRDIAELAWVLEDLLNRCLDGAVPLSDSIVEFTARARGELGAMLERGLDSTTELQSWREQAAALARGAKPEPVGAKPDPAASAAPTPKTEIEPKPVSESGAAAGEEPAQRATPEEPVLQSIGDLGDRGHKLVAEDGDRDRSSPFSDDEVIKIFSKEALSHIAAIRSVVEHCNREGKAAVSKELLRAVHTLRGNARSLHLVEMSEAYSALDDALHARTSRGASLQKSEMDLLEALLVSTAKVLDHLNRDKRFPDVIRQELDELAGRIGEEWGDRNGEGEAAGKDRLGGLQLVSDFVTDTADEDERGSGEKPGDGKVFDRLDEPGRHPAAAAPGRAVPEKAPEEAEDVRTPDTEARTADDGEAIDADIKDVFMEEASDILSRFESSLREARGSGIDSELTNTLKRELHTLKGSARATGMEVIGDLSHDAETMLEGAAKAPSPPEDLLDVLEEVHDTLVSLIQEVEAGRVSKPDQKLVDRLRGRSPQAAPDIGGPQGEESGEFRQPKPAGGPRLSLIPEDASSPPQSRTEDGTQAEDANAGQVDADVPVAAETARATGGGRATVRIHSNVLDKLVNYAGEVSISRAQLEEQLSGLKGNLNELRANVARFSDQVRELDIQADSQIRSRVAEEQVSDAGHDFDPLEMDRYSRLQQLSRSLSESVDDLVTIQTGLNRFAAQTEGVLSQQAMLNSELQDGLMSARMVPFNTLVPRLRHRARQTARELGKEIDFTVTGSELEVDRNILDQLSEALEHMIRNSLDHGIESPDVRTAAGKPARGTLRIDCSQEGNEVLLKFSDDGAGLNVERIKAQAVEAGLLSPDTDLSDDEVIQLIVLSGFSTAQSVTQLSGRGVGLDVVNDAVRRLGGSLTLDNRPGAGVSFEMRLPLSLSITQAMFVLCGGQRFAIPLGAIETVLKTEPENLTERSKDGDPVFRHDDNVYTLMDLTAALGLEATPADKRVPILIVRMGAREVAVRVDELVGTDEIVVKQLGDHLGRMSGINGATITGDGSVVIILDLAELWLAQERLPAFRHEAPQTAETPPKVMVVDDSLTVRKVTGRNLGRHGMEVTMARDGIDALEQLAKGKPDVMLVDIEMPRMDGYELTTRIREDVNYQDIPIIVITSRAGTKHREKAMELGANAYLTKPYQERDLLREVNALLSGATESTVH